MYNIVDLLDKLIILEQKGSEMYRLISIMEGLDKKIKVVARVLANEEKRHEQIYRNYKDKIEKMDLPFIDFDIYDKASNLINNFNYPVSENMKDIQELLSFALDFEKQSISLIISIQGLLIRDTNDSSSITYKVLTQIIKEEEKHIEDIERFIH